MTADASDTIAAANVPEDPGACAARLVQEKRAAEAVALLREAGASAPLQAWEELADLLWQQADHLGAEPAYQEVLARAPRHDTALIRMSMYFEWRGDLEGAKAFLRGDGTEALTGPVAARLGHLRLHSSDHVNAEGVLRFAVAQPNTPVSAWRDLSETLHALGRRPEAMAVAREAFARQPNDTEVRAWLGHLLLDGGEAGLAVEHLGAALAAGDAPPFARLRHAEALFRTQQPDACVAEARRALEEQPDAPPVRALVGYLLIQCGSSADGERLMEEAIAADPLSPGLRMLHSAAFFDGGRIAEAAAAARDAAEAMPDNIELVDRYGHILLQYGDYRTARGVFHHAIKVKSDHLNAWLGLCEAARLSKQFKEAIAAFRKLGELGADAQTIRNQRFRLFGEMT